MTAGLEAADATPTGSTRTLRVVIADQNALFREAVKTALQAQGNISIVDEAHDGFYAIVAARTKRPDVIVLNADLPRCDAVQAARLIQKENPAAGVIILGIQDDVDLIISGVEAGVTGFLMEDSRLGELFDAVWAVDAGVTSVPARMLGPVLDRLVRRNKQQDGALRQIMQLTRREREVLATLSEGANNQAIAAALGISPQTSRTHVQHVLSKLGLHSKLEAAAFVIKNGIFQELLADQADREIKLLSH